MRRNDHTIRDCLKTMSAAVNMKKNAFTRIDSNYKWHIVEISTHNRLVGIYNIERDER